MKKCCIFTADGNYDSIVADLNIFIGDFQFEYDVRPFGLVYRDCDLYIIDSSGVQGDALFRLINRLPFLSVSRCYTVFALWSEETEMAFLDFADPNRHYKNVVPINRADWVQQLTKSLRSTERKKADGI